MPDDIKASTNPATTGAMPPITGLNHFAFEIATYEEVLAARERLVENGVEVIGPTDHGFIHSIYFFDPNNLQLEITCRMEGASEAKIYEDRAHDHLKKWLAAHPKPAA